MNYRKEEKAPQVYMPNKLISLKSPFVSVFQTRVFYLALKEVYKNRNDLNFTNQTIISIPMTDFIENGDSQVVYSNASSKLDELADLKYVIEELGVRKIIYQIFDTVEYVSGEIKIKLGCSIFPAIKNYAEQLYTKVPLKLCFDLSTNKQIHFAETLLSLITHNTTFGEFSINIKELQDLLAIDKMRNWSTFNQNFLSPTIKRINLSRSSDFLFRYTPIKKGRAFESLLFEYSLAIPNTFNQNAFLQFYINGKTATSPFVQEFSAHNNLVNNCANNVLSDECNLEKSIHCCLCNKNKSNLFYNKYNISD